MGVPISSSNLKVGYDYTVQATFHNDAPGNANNAQIDFFITILGAGGTWDQIGDSQFINIPADGGTAIAEVQWAPPVTGHICFVAYIHHDYDESFTNNMGQENTHVHPVTSPGEANFTITNPTGTPALVYLEARQVDHPDNIWPAYLLRDYPQTLNPGKNQTVWLIIEAPDDALVNETRLFSVSGYINDELIGGLEIEFVVKRPPHSITPPIVIFPNGGEKIECGNVTIRWNAAIDSRDHEITYSVYYSSNGGTVWKILHSGLVGTSLVWDVTTITDSPGNEYSIKVLAICSEGLSASDTSDALFEHLCGAKTAEPDTSIGYGMTLIGLSVLGLLVRHPWKRFTSKPNGEIKKLRGRYIP